MNPADLNDIQIQKQTLTDLDDVKSVVLCYCDAHSPTDTNNCLGIWDPGRKPSVYLSVFLMSRYGFRKIVYLLGCTAHSKFDAYLVVAIIERLG